MSSHREYSQYSTYSDYGTPLLTTDTAAYPVAGNGGARQAYSSATPLNAVSRTPVPVDCPTCGERAMTTTRFKVGNYNQ